MHQHIEYSIHAIPDHFDFPFESGGLLYDGTSVDGVGSIAK